MRRLLLCGALVGAAAFLPATAQATVTCNGTLSGTVNQSVLVPSGSTCTLNGARIAGNVTVNSGGVLTTGTILSNTISGDVTNHGGDVTLSCFTISGSLTSTGGGVNLPGNGTSCVRRVNGSVSVSGANPADLLDTSIGGRVSVTGSVSAPFIEGNQIGGSLSITANAGTAQVFGNLVGGALGCVANATAPNTGGNSVSGARSGQCAGSS
jgi:hypothetical protein